jgi:hypothetical protein
MCTVKFLVTTMYVHQNAQALITRPILTRVFLLKMTVITTSKPDVEHRVYVSMTKLKASTKENTTKVTHREHRCKKKRQN